MTKTILFLGAIATSAVLLSPIAASAETAPSATASLANNVAATAQVPDGNSNAAQAPVAEKKICKQLPSSYSRMTKRTCLTEKEWKQVEQESQD
jgi:hypothetical protein